MPSLDRMWKIVAAKEASMLLLVVVFFFLCFAAVSILPSVLYVYRIHFFLLVGENTTNKGLCKPPAHSNAFKSIAVGKASLCSVHAVSFGVVLGHQNVPSVGQPTFICLCFQAQGD